jgi:transaldolase/glucose-6-phosphate isomerase
MAWTIEGMELRPAAHAAAIEARLARWEAAGFGRRLWARDPTLWSAEALPELADRMGWLGLPEEMPAAVPELGRLGAELAAEGVRDLVVLGMGGSSLAPEVFQRTLGNRAGHPRLAVLDSTHPGAVRGLAAHLELPRTLFLVSSKSGTTTETLSFFRAFWHLAERAVPEAPGARFAAITDPGTPLAELARERGFRRTFEAPPEVGGRYSALSAFGLVPAAGIGADIAALLESARRMAAACGPAVPARGNAGLVLGAALGELALAGRDKLTFLAAPGLESFPDWIEQLVAESTGKQGRGIVPVVEEPPAPAAAYGGDRVFVGLVWEEREEAAEMGVGARVAQFAAAGHPTVILRLRAPVDLGAEMLRWEIAVAAAGAVLGINPFDQPDVQLAKELARKALGAAGRAPAAAPAAGEETVEAAAPGLARALAEWLAAARPGGYVGIHAYLAPRPAVTAALRRLQGALRDATGLAATMGYGPRFLHSTGQLHKGGPPGGLFLQLVDRPREELAVPEGGFGFGALLAAQAEGDRRALLQRGRRVLRVDLGAEALSGLEALADALAARQAGVEGEPE